MQLAKAKQMLRKPYRRENGLIILNGLHPHHLFVSSVCKKNLCVSRSAQLKQLVLFKGRVYSSLFSVVLCVSSIKHD